LHKTAGVGPVHPHGHHASVSALRAGQGLPPRWLVARGSPHAPAGRRHACTSAWPSGREHAVATTSACCSPGACAAH